MNDLSIPTTLTADQILAALQKQPDLSIDWGDGAARRSLYLEDEPRPGQEFCSFRAMRATDKHGGARVLVCDHLEEALQWLLAR